MNANSKENLDEYFKPLYLGIYRIRMLIEMHSNIVDVSDQLCNQNFWGCLQNNIIISSVLIELFSILENFPAKQSEGKRDDNKLHKNILKNLNDDEKKQLENILSKLNNNTKKYKKIRNALAHKGKDNYHGHNVDYKTILDLLNEFENELDDIICSRYDDYYLVSTTQTLNPEKLIGPTIIRQTSYSENKYYYCGGTRHCFITIINKELYDKIEFPDTDESKKLTLSLMPKETLIDINKIRLKETHIKPQTKPDKKTFPVLAELDKILDMEIDMQNKR